MTNSYICNLINNNPNWEQICEEKYIKVKKNKNLAIFNYDIFADFTDPIVQEARGIIIDIESKTVVCWPFRKFGNSYEYYVDEINWETASVQEKIDGSIIKLWYDSESTKWNISSNSCIDAKEAKLNTGLTLDSLVRSTEQYKTFCKLDENEQISKTKTYIFELVGPDNQVVIRYQNTMMYLIGVRDNITGIELNPEIYKDIFPLPKRYKLSSLEKCITAAETLNTDDYPNNEGFVVVDDNFHRMKIKSPQYLIYHHAVNNGMITKEKAYELLTSDDFNLKEFCKMASKRNVTIIQYYDEEIVKAETEIKKTIKNVRNMYNNGLSRKEIAFAIKDNPYSYYGFKAIGNNDLPESIIAKQGKKILKLIEDFPEDDKDNAIKE